MSDKVQLGLRVDRELYEEFKERVRERRGRWQGVGGDEMENAIRHYLRFGADKPLPDQLAEFNARLERIEGAVGTAESDGGTDTIPTDSHTHTPDTEITERPDPQAATERKVRWLAKCVIDEVVPKSKELDSVPKSTLQEIVKDEYGFRSDTAKRYVDELIDHFELSAHPTADGIYVSAEMKETIIERKREQAREEADSTLNNE